MSGARSKSNKHLTVDEHNWFGEFQELGKTEARQSFLHLLDNLKDDPTSLAITDRGEKVAVIMGYKYFQTLMRIVRQNSKPNDENPLAGLITKAGNLKDSKVKVNALFQESFRRTSKSI